MDGEAVSAPVQLSKAVDLAREAGVLRVANWSHSGSLIARAPDQEQLRVYPPGAVPALLATAIARRGPSCATAYLELLDAMEDLAEVMTWTAVTSWR